MPEIKNNFLRGVMNKDLDERLVPNGQYIDALNVEVTTSEDGGTISNIKGNLRVDNLPLYAEQEYICVGSIVDEKNNSIYWFISGRTIDAIAEFNVDTEETTMVAVDELKQTNKAFLRFSKKNITGINIIDDFLLFTDNTNEPKKINIKRFKEATDGFQHTKLIIEGVDYGNVEEQHVTAIKKAPTQSPKYTINYTEDARLANYKRSLFERIFPRFAFRYKYVDGEYSAFSPFTGVVFNPYYRRTFNDNNYYSPQEGHNTSMMNYIDSINLYDFVPKDIPQDVVQVDLLYKQDDSPTVYSVAKIKKDSNDWNARGFESSVWTSSNTTSLGDLSIDKGRYIVSTENIYAAIPENQLLRPWDNLPRKALAQEVTGNRVVYGNYVQGYDVDSEPNIQAAYEQKKYYSTLSEGGVSSVKSLRDYQLGFVLGDKYGRETPVITSTNANVKVPFSDSDGVVAINPISLCAELNFEFPEWAEYFKFYVKQTAGEYYNLIIDKAYDPATYSEFQNEPTHTWIAVNSSERNKITEDTYITIKKVLTPGDYEIVSTSNRYKVLNIESQVPEMIAYRFDSLGLLTNADQGDGEILANDSATGIFQSNDSRIDHETDFIKIDKSEWLSNGGSKLDFSADKNVQSGDGISLFISWRTSNNENSERYKVTMIDTEGENYQLRLARKISLEDAKLASFSGTANQTTTNTLATGLQFTVEDRTKREKEDFDGKFFVKVSADTVVKSTVIQESEDTLGDFYYSSQQGVRWFADPQTSDTHTNGELDGLYNQDPYLGTPESVPEGITLDTTVTDTEDAWDSLVSDSAVGKGFFIDNMAFVAAQTSVSNYARFAAQAFSANFVTYSRPIWNEGSFYADNSVSGTFDSWIINSAAPNAYLNTTNVDDWQLRISNGMDGIVQTNSRHVGDTEDSQGSIVGSRRWRDNIYSSSESAFDNTYKEEPGKIFMHLSFLAPGKDLHDGSFSDTTASLSNTDTYGPNSIAKDLQGIWGGGIFTKQNGTKFGASSSYGRIVEFEGNYSSQLNNGFPNPLEEAASPDEGQGYDNSYQSLHERQWDPTFALNENPSTLEFVNNLVAGRKFKFSDDTSNTIYTIKSVAIKKLYNHTPWKARYIYDGSDIVLAQDSVEEAAVDWAVAKANNSNDINSKANVLKEKIVDFGRANNRRVCYVLELDKDPREASFNPVSGGSGNVDVNTPTTMQFVSANPPILSGITNRFPGIVETEPKDNLGLNIYYEASSAIPTKLNIDNVLNFAPIGSEVVFNIPEAMTGQRLVTQSIHVARWNVVTDENLLVFYARPKDLSNNGFNKFDANGDIISYNNAEVRFYKDDGSYNTAVVLSAVDIGNQMATSTQTYDDLGVEIIFIIKRELDTTKKFGLGWNNCYVFGDSIESNRIRDDFNQAFISNGAKASTTIEEPYAEERRKSGLIYSGIYNSNTGKNNLNQFIQAEKITKDLNPTYGSIQKLFSRNTDLVSFCEDRVVKILANKDALFNADGNVNVVATSNVLGQVVPFVGEYGISKNPESFASESYRAYFTDEKRGAVLRLSMDGLTPISDAGMRDYFRDNLRNYSKILGSYDDFKKEFNLTLCHEYPENIITNEFLTVGDEQQSVLQTLEIVENPNFNLGTDLTLVNINDLFTGGYQKLNNTSFNHTVEIINHDELVVPGTIGQALIPDISQQFVSYEVIAGQGGRVMYRWRGKGLDTSSNNNPFISPGAGQIAFDSIFGKGGGGGQSYLDQNDVSQGLANEDIEPNANLIYYKESASNSALNNTIGILEDVILFRNLTAGEFTDNYIQVPGTPTSGSYPNNSVNSNLLDDVDEQGNQRGFPDAHNMQCYAGEEVEVIVRFGALGAGDNKNGLAFRVYDGSSLLSNDKIYNPGTDGNNTPYAGNGIPFDSPDSGEIDTNNLGYQTNNTILYEGATGSFGAGGQFSDQVFSFRLKFKKPGTDPSSAQDNDDTAARTNLEFSEKVVENLQIRISKYSDGGVETVFIRDIFIYKNYRLVRRGYPFQAGQPFIESVPDLIVPAWAEVKQNNPSNWTASNNAINLTFGGEQVYGPSNPGVNETYNGQQYFNGSSNGVTDYNEFADGTYDVTGWTSEIHADTTNLSPNNTQYLTQSLSNPLEYNHWYVLDLEYGAGFNVDGDPNTVFAYGVAPYGVQTSVPGAVVGEQDSTISNSAYGTNEESNNPYYPEGFFGGVTGSNLIGAPKSISLKPVIRTEYGAPGAAVYRCIFKFVEDSYAGGNPTYGGTSGVNSNGTSFTTGTISNPGATLQIGFWNVDFKYKSAILIDITDTSTGGIVQDWSAAGFGSSVNHALDARKMFYNNGGFNWNIPAQPTYVNDKYIQQDHSEGSVEYPYYNETNEGYELAFEIQKCDFQDQEVSGALRVAVRNHDSLGVDLRKIDKEGSYKVQYNYNDNQPTLLESPENSLVEIGPASSGIGAAVGQETALVIRPDISNNNNSEFIGKLSKFSITRKENILSGGNIGAWDIVSVTQDNPEIFFENQAITFENAPPNAQIRQAISPNLEVGKTYKLEFNFSQFTSGKLSFYYFNPLNGEGFVKSIFAEDSEEGFFSENFIIGSDTGSTANAWGSLLFFASGSEQLNVSIDNISLTEVLYDLAEETTVSFSEDVKGWTSFKSFIPDQAISCTSKYFSFNKARLYEHYVGDYNVFYDVFNESFVEFLFNQGPSSIKNFKTISYEGEEGWIATINTKEDDGFINEFIKKEDKWYNYIRGQQNDYYDGNNVQGLGIVSSVVSLTSDEGDITEDF